MDGKMKVRVNTEIPREAEAIVKASDVSKYNLRCNRNLSERMTKKDFIYDICRPLQSARKLEKVKVLATIVPAARRRNQLWKPSNCLEISKKRFLAGGGDATVQYPIQRIMNFECNFCREQIATLFSLSTHVKFHRRKYCKQCYWVLEDGETLQKHYEKKHDGFSTPQIFVDS